LQQGEPTLWTRGLSPNLYPERKATKITGKPAPHKHPHVGELAAPPLLSWLYSVSKYCALILWDQSTVNYLFSSSSLTNYLLILHGNLHSRPKAKIVVLMLFAIDLLIKGL
jgi:hypothetical protein